MQPVLALRRIDPLLEQGADLRPPELVFGTRARNKFDLGPDIADVVHGMGRAVAPVRAEQRARLLAHGVLTKGCPDGDAVATLLAYRVDEVVQALLARRTTEVLDVLRADRVTVPVQSRIVPQLLLACWVIQVVDRLAVDEVAARTRGLQLAGAAQLWRKAHLLACDPVSLRTLVVVARVLVSDGETEHHRKKNSSQEGGLHHEKTDRGDSRAVANKVEKCESCLLVGGMLLTRR